MSHTAGPHLPPHTSQNGAQTPTGTWSPQGSLGLSLTQPKETLPTCSQAEGRATGRHLCTGIMGTVGGIPPHVAMAAIYCRYCPSPRRRHLYAPSLHSEAPSPTSSSLHPRSTPYNQTTSAPSYVNGTGVSMLNERTRKRMNE